MEHFQLNKDQAVSPVIAVMLMLVVTIIIAAVVSGFAGSLVGTNGDKAPTLSMDVKIMNSGDWISSGFYATITGASEPIKTKNLKLVTQWRSSTNSGGNTTTGGIYNFDCWIPMNSGQRISTSVAPYGYGSGVNSSSTVSHPRTTGYYLHDEMQFGNYTLIPGTTMMAMPSGSKSGQSVGGSPGVSDTTGGGYGVETPFIYKTAGHYTSDMTDGVQAVLGHNWETLRAGDKVSVAVIHIPTGKTIFQRDVTVTEG